MRSAVWADGWRLAVLVAVAAGLHAWLVPHTTVPARDGVVFARAAYRFDRALAGGEETPLGIVRTTEHPPGYPLAVCGVARLTGLSKGTDPPADYLLAAQIANAAAGVLLVLPCYLIGRQAFGRNVGFAAALIFQVLPVPARVTADALSEGPFLLMVALAVAFAVRAAAHPRAGWFLACGLATGAAYLVRPEGLLAAGPPILLTLAGVVRWRVPAASGAVRVAAVLVGVAVFAGPYITAIGRLTNKPTGVELQRPLDARRPVHAGPLFAAWADPNDSGPQRVAWAAKALLSELGKGTHYGVGVLALVAVAVLWRRNANNPGWRVLLLAGGLSAALLAYLAVRRGYLSERHTVLLALVACQLTAALLPVWAEWAGRILRPLGRVDRRWTAAGLLALLVLSAVPVAVRPHHTRDGPKVAGRWLGEHAAPADRVIDPYTLAEWYAGRSLTQPGDWTPDLPAVTFVVLENTPTPPESPLPMLQWARDVVGRPGAEVVWHWPDDAPQDKARLHVWRVPTGR